MWDGADIKGTRCRGAPVFAALITVAGLSPALSAEESANTSFSDPSVLSPAIHATRLDYSEFDVPEAVTVITRDDIRRAGYLEISEIFRSVPGFRIVKIGDESRLGYHGTTVAQHRRMLITIDGRNVLIGDSQYVEFDRLPIELEDIERVTITRGPNGAAYGDNAFLASVDFQTVGRDSPRGFSVRAGGGYNDREKVAASLNESVRGYDVQLSAAMEQDGGYDYYDAQKTPRDDGKDTKRGRVAIEREFVEGSRWRLDGSFYDSKNKTGVQTIRTTGEQQNQGEFFALSHEQELGEFSRLDWFVSHNRQRESMRQSACYTPETIAGLLAIVTNPVDRVRALAPTQFVPQLLGTSLENTCFFLDVATESKRNELEVEFESRRGAWNYLFGGSATQVDASSGQRFAGMDQRQRSYRLFSETALRLGPVHTSIGVMAQDSSNVEDTEVAWRGAVNWLVRPNQTLRYSYASSFRIPSLTETETFWTGEFRFGRSGEPLSTYQFSLPIPIVTSTTRLKPETIESNSVGYFGTFFRSSTTIDVKVFHETIRDRVQADVMFFSPPPFNGDAFTLRGAETEVSVRLNDYWRITGQYSYLDTDARAAFERGMHGDHAGSFAATYRPSAGHEFTVAYYGNSTISGNTYDRYDLVYNYNRQLGDHLFRSQLVFQHHVGGVDGLRGDVPFLRNEGYFAHINQLFVNFELTF
jgi:iron complex outermembrane recepter protein